MVRPRVLLLLLPAVFQDTRNATTGQFLIDEAVLRGAGVTDFERYAVTPGAPVNLDIFLD